MTKIPSVEERVEEFEKLLDENEGITVGEDITPYVYDIITADRLALLTELREWSDKNKWDITRDITVIRLSDLQAHLDELIKSNNIWKPSSP